MTLGLCREVLKGQNKIKKIWEKYSGGYRYGQQVPLPVHVAVAQPEHTATSYIVAAQSCTFPEAPNGALVDPLRYFRQLLQSADITAFTTHGNKEGVGATHGEPRQQ